jgi:hypothetical protein
MLNNGSQLFFGMLLLPSISSTLHTCGGYFVFAWSLNGHMHGVYVCMHICRLRYVCMHVCVHVYDEWIMDACMCAWMNVCVCAYEYMCLYPWLNDLINLFCLYIMSEVKLASSDNLILNRHDKRRLSADQPLLPISRRVGNASTNTDQNLLQFV